MITSFTGPAILEDDQAEDPESAYLPSPEQIRQMCAGYQRRWSERERKKRSFCTPLRWTAPEVTICFDPSPTAEE